MCLGSIFSCSKLIWKFRVLLLMTYNVFGLHLENTESLVSQFWNWKCLGLAHATGLHKETVVSPSCKVSNLPFATPYIRSDQFHAEQPRHVSCQNNVLKQLTKKWSFEGNREILKTSYQPRVLFFDKRKERFIYLFVYLITYLLVFEIRALCSSKEKTGSNNYNYGTFARKQIQVYFASLLDFIVTRFEKLRSQDIL